MKRDISKGLVVLFCGLFLCQPVAAEKKLKLVYKDDFEKGAKNWEPTDKNAWRLRKTAKGLVYNQFKGSKYKPPHRSPVNISLLKDVYVGDFVLKVKVRSTIKDYGHRDMCLFFGYQDKAHFYYVHLGKKTDDHANQIFIVDGKPRTKISIKTTKGTNWDDEWHNVMIVRNAKDGTIKVFFDNMKTPIMVAKNTKFTWGRVGLGSFDDKGEWDNLELRGQRVKPKKSPKVSK